MDDEFSDLFLLNDCLLSGRLSPGLPDDFLAQRSHDAMLSASSGHQGEIPASYLCFDAEPDLGYSDSLRRSSSIGPSTIFLKPMDKAANGSAGLFAYVKSEESSVSPSGRSPDHDYLKEVKMEGVSELAENGGVGSICSSKTASSAEYCHGTVGDGNNDNGIAARYDVDDYYCSSVETKPLRDTRIVSSSHTVNGNSTAGISGFLLTSVTSGVVAAAPETLMVGVEESDGDNLTAKSEASDRDTWPCGPIFPRGEDDAVPSGDDNSSTTSGDSCSNCGYLSSGSPAPNHQHGVLTYPSHHQAGHRYRSANSASAAMNMNLRTRSKMHELALKNHLISEQDPRSKGYVLLSTEERRTLVQEGLPVPTKLPLSKQEEEALKIVRRKIKNKLSAQESRRKRKEYMETLEQQIEGYQTENSSLKRRIDVLEKTNQSLMGQLKKLQQQFTPVTSPTSATALFVGNGHNSASDGSTTTRTGSSTHHGVSLAAVFLLFAVMIPAMPVWPSVFRNAFIANSMMAKSSGIDDVSSSSPYYDHSSNTIVLPASRVLWSGGGNGDCEIPYSAEYFEKLNECRHDDGDSAHVAAKGSVEPHITVFFSAAVNYSESSKGIAREVTLPPTEESQLSSTAVCETVACRESLAARKTVANA